MHGSFSQHHSSAAPANDRPGSLLAAVQFRQALDRTKMPASAQKIGGFNRIVQSAELFLQYCEGPQRPSLARYLSAYAEECTDPESDTFVPDQDAQPCE
jgi:hypothetical protein